MFLKKNKGNVTLLEFLCQEVDRQEIFYSGYNQYNSCYFIFNIQLIKVVKLIMKAKDFYTQTHLVVAAIRIYSYQNSEAPSVEAICKTLSIATEQGHLVCKKLDEMEIIEMVKGPYGSRLFIKDHLKIEEIPKDDPGTSIKDELERFQNTQKDFKQKIEEFKAKKDEEQKNLFAQIEERLKKKKSN
ncbi:Uncharacterized protein dnl_40680 [Desulfonema limicola]|uniref:Uncharacterized protein n=2 Tax=Desulfonema limicola TaxID=45656 RepID=A0A975BAI5_9BACT|nr:Uncharacterized protein dnl_40680 [Desulfonema limicola]